MSNNNEEEDCKSCRRCKNLGVEVRSNGSLDIQCDTESLLSKCQSWLEKCTISNDGESIASSESFSTNSSSNSEGTDNSGDFSNELQMFPGAIVAPQNESENIVREVFNQTHAYGPVRIEKSQEVHLGNITNIYGPVYITQAFSTINQRSVTNQVLLDLPAPTKHGELSILYRKNWLALAPVQERTLLEGPAKFVIISHTVSEPNDNSQMANSKLVNSIQKYHMTKRNFDDIGYNFLIGSDGNVYEGRGWSIVGAHAHKYNRVSVGISFMGYFCEKLPTDEALKQARVLIERGVKLGAIEENYILLGHCQCSATESPGEKLYWEIQKWDNWDRKIDVQHPSPLVEKFRKN